MHLLFQGLFDLESVLLLFMFFGLEFVELLFTDFLVVLPDFLLLLLDFLALLFYEVCVDVVDVVMGGGAAVAHVLPFFL